MSQIYFRCNGCHKPLRIDARRAGQAIRCPRCYSEMLVPTSSERIVPTTPVTPDTLSPAPARREYWPMRRTLTAAGGVFLLLVVGTIVGLAWPEAELAPGLENEAPLSAAAEQSIAAQPDDGGQPEEVVELALAPAVADQPPVKAPPLDEVAFGPEPPMPADDEANEAEDEGVPPPAAAPAPLLVGPPAPMSQPETMPFKRRHQLTEDQLRKQLAWAPEVRNFNAITMASNI
jgi:hypothetical protein